MELLLVASAFVIGFVFTNLMVPPIVRVAHAKKLFDTNGGRKIHTQIVPPLGGVAIFIGFIFSAIVATDGLSFDALKYIIAAVTLLFFIGLKDDLVEISARNKFLVQIFAAIVLISLGDLRFTNLHGILGIYEINYAMSVLISVLITVAIVNAFNLIDGIDGLASGLAILASAVFGVHFYLSGQAQFAILALALTGSLSGFFIYNVFGKKNKMFMGDTGSLIIGMVISALVIKFNEIGILRTDMVVRHTPVISLAIIIVPLIDMLRVMTIRIIQKRSPFSADNNHIHHRLLTLYPKHLTVTMIIISTNILLILFALILDSSAINVNIQFILLASVACFLSFLPSRIIRSNKARKIKYNKLHLESSMN